MKKRFTDIALGFDILVEAVTETQNTIRQSISDSILAGGKIESIQSEYGHDLKKLELLLAKIKEAEGVLRGNYSSDTKETKTPAKKESAKRCPRGGILAKIERVLKESATPLKCKEIARRTGMKINNLNVWFSTTGKKHPQIKKTAPGTFWYDANLAYSFYPLAS